MMTTVTLWDTGSSGRVAFNRLDPDHATWLARELLRTARPVGEACVEQSPTDPEERCAIRMVGRGVTLSGGTSGGNSFRGSVAPQIWFSNPPPLPPWTPRRRIARAADRIRDRVRRMLYPG